MDISVVIPLFNEEESLPELATWIHKVMAENHFSYEIIFVDDGSRDHSWEVIQNLKKENANIKGIRFRKNYGKSAGLNVGFQAAEGEVIITMDADLQDSPDEIPDLYKMIMKDGNDLVSGYKKERHDPITKTIPTKLYNWATRKVSGISNLHDFNCGLKSYRKDVVKSIEVYGEMHRYIPVIAKSAGYTKIAEKIVAHRARKYGVTKFGVDRFLNGFLDLLTIYFISRYMKRPMHFFGFWGTFFGMIGSGVLVYLLGVKIVTALALAQIEFVSQRIPLMFFGTITFLLGILLLSTGLLAELIGRNSPYRNDYDVKERI